MKGLLLAGGHGTRLRPLTFTGNKHMLPIGNKPMILYGLEHLIKAGMNEIGVVLGPINEDIKSFLGDGARFGVNIAYIDQPEPKGLAHAIAMSEGFLRDEPFAMYLGDNLLKQGAEPLVKTFGRGDADCVIAVTQVKDPSRYGIVVFNQEKRIETLVEKPKQSISNWALIGVYVFNSKIFEAIRRIKPSWRGELEITDAIQVLLKSGGRIDVQFVQGWWKDTGRPEDLLEANQLVLQDLQSLNEGAIEEGAILTGIVRIGKHTKINKRTTIRGPVVIGEHCEIGPNTYVGSYTSIGNGSTIRNAELENSILMEGAHIDCGKRIVDSLIGRNVTVIGAENSVPRGVKLVLGDMAHVQV